MADEKQLSDGRPEGACLGQSSSDKIGFYGTAPVARGTLTQLASTKTSTQLRAELSALQNELARLGIIAVS